MTETNDNLEPQEKSGGETDAEQTAPAEQPVSVQPAIGELSNEENRDARMWAMFCHLGGLGGLIFPGVGSIVAPLIIWQIKKDDFPFVDEQGKEAVNFQISMVLYAVIGSAACLVTCIGAPLIPIVCFAVGVVDLVFLLIAAVKANNGYHYRYPLTIRFIK